MRILYVSDPYPHPTRPNHGVFSYRFVQQLVADNHDVVVISPSNFEWVQLKSQVQGYGNEGAQVYWPRIFTLSSKNVFGYNTYMISHMQKTRAVKQVLKRIDKNFDLVLCQFISSALYTVDALGGNGYKIFVDVGENMGIVRTKSWYKVSFYNRLLESISGYIAVSQTVKKKIMEINGTSSNDILVAENGTDLESFNVYKKEDARIQLGLPSDKFIIIFVGRYIHSKGPLRLLEATKDMDDVGLLMVGNGEQQLESDSILFKDKVPKDKIPLLLAASDLFVLPTLHEGSNNSIIEAMAAGLPIVSADIPEVREQVTPEAGILVDPMDVDKIKEAICRIKDDDELRRKLSWGAKERSRKFDLRVRYQCMMDFMNSRL